MVKLWSKKKKQRRNAVRNLKKKGRDVKLVRDVLLRKGKKKRKK